MRISDWSSRVLFRSPADRDRIFDRGVRLDSNKPGTGLGLAIVRDVAEIYGGSNPLEESEDLGGVLVRLTLPAGQDEAAAILRLWPARAPRRKPGSMKPPLLCRIRSP